MYRDFFTVDNCFIFEIDCLVTIISYIQKMPIFHLVDLIVILSAFLMYVFTHLFILALLFIIHYLLNLLFITANAAIY